MRHYQQNYDAVRSGTCVPRRMQDAYSYIRLESHLLPITIGYMASVSQNSDVSAPRRVIIRDSALLAAAEMLHHNVPSRIILRAMQRRITTSREVDPAAAAAFQDASTALRRANRSQNPPQP